MAVFKETFDLVPTISHITASGRTPAVEVQATSTLVMQEILSGGEFTDDCYLESSLTATDAASPILAQQHRQQRVHRAIWSPPLWSDQSNLKHMYRRLRQLRRKATQPPLLEASLVG